MNIVFQYAVKFICGKSEGKILAPGQYWTAINVHNPTNAIATVRKKIAVALPDQKAGPVSKWMSARLGPDEAFEIDCPELMKILESRANFAKGFVVIESHVQLDVVAVYTVAGREERVESIHTERVPARRVEVGLPDLVPVPDEHGFFCKRKDHNLIVTVKNQGTAGAGQSVTEVDFFQYGKATRPTPPLAPGAAVDLAFPIPDGCFDSDCEFRITVDVNGDVSESDEGNNFATGICIG